MLSALIGLLIVVAFFGAAYYLLESLPMPDPFRTVLRVVAVLIALVILVMVFQEFTGGATWPTFPRRLR